MEGVEARPGLREVRDPLLGVRHHQVAVQEGVRKVLPQGLDDGRTESQVRDEVAGLPGRSGTRACKEKGGEGEGAADWDVAWHSVRAGLSPDGVGQPASLAEGVARAPSGWRWSDLGRTPSPISQSAKRPAARGRRSPATRNPFGVEGRAKPAQVEGRSLTITSTCSQSAPQESMRSDSSASLAKSLLRIEGEILHAGLSVIAEPIFFVRCPASSRTAINQSSGAAAFWRGSALQIRARWRQG